MKELRIAIPSYSESDLISYSGLLSSALTTLQIILKNEVSCKTTGLKAEIALLLTPFLQHEKTSCEYSRASRQSLSIASHHSWL